MQHDFILVDRSGSMEGMWDEALGSVNAYVKKLAEDKVDTGVTLAVFDAEGGRLKFDVIRERIIPSTWKDVSRLDATPRGMTPLNDAIGRIVALARAGNYEKVAIIIMTDGKENASHELRISQAQALLNEVRSQGWQVLFLGANFDNALQAESYGARSTQSANFAQGNLRKGMEHTASLRSAYSSGAAATMDFDESDKADLAKVREARRASA